MRKWIKLNGGRVEVLEPQSLDEAVARDAADAMRWADYMAWVYLEDHPTRANAPKGSL